MEIIESDIKNQQPSKKEEVQESISKLAEMLTIKEEKLPEIFKTLATTEITPEIVTSLVDLPNIEMASLSIKTVMTQIPFYIEMMKTQPEAMKPFQYMLARVGLVAKYAKENPDDKPPYTKGENKSGWDLSQEQIDEFNKSLEESVLTKAQAIIDHPDDETLLPRKQESYEDAKIEQLTTAIAYLKVKAAFPKEETKPEKS